MNLKKPYILLLIFLSCTSLTHSQQIKIGNYTFPAGGEYQGEMLKGKPYGKGTTTFPNGDIHTGNYVKGKREGHGVYQFADGENTTENGFRISNTV